ncbi:MAG TPA: protein kinase [Gemmataceae bacterium]|nr:protein kinase [Gemmataceae bacterium]
MPAPSSVTEFLELTRRSGIVEDDKRLTAYVQQLQSANQLPSEPNKLAGLMIRDGFLTFFQAEQLLLGKWKRFKIGRYKVLERLGSGGMGQVFLCEHTMMRRRVAVKVLPAAKADDPSSLERFYREARAVAALDHPNIVRAYDIDQDDNLHFLVMEYVDGSNFQEIIKKTGPMSPLRACHYMYDSAKGLQHAFDTAGLVHRDIKPGNILVDRYGLVKILDMGLARFFHDEDDLLTRKYDESVLGTADYLAPEQAIDSHNVDIRADIYSLGATFYFLLTGSPPFTEGTVAQKLIWHQTRDPKPIPQIRPEVPAEVVAVVEKMMTKDVSLRYQSPAAVAEALAPLITTPIPPPPEDEMPKLSPAAMASPSISAPATPPPRPAIPSTPSAPHPASSKAEIGLAPPATTLGSSRPTVPGLNAQAPKQLSPTEAAPIRRDAPRPNSKPAIAVTPPPQTVPAFPPSHDEPNQDWAAFTAETPNPRAQGDTDRKQPTYKPPSATLQAPKSAKKVAAPMPAALKGVPKWALLALAGVLLGVATVAAAFALGVFGGKPRNTPSTNTTEQGDGALLIVDANARGSAYRYLWEAITKAKPGSRILVRSDIEERWENVRLPKGISIEADVAPGTYISWRLPPNVDPKTGTKAVLQLNDVEGVHIKGFSFDGQNRAENGIYLYSHCPGLTFEDVRIVNCKLSAIKLSNAKGEKDRPITFTRVRASGTASSEATIYLFASTTYSIPANEDVVIQDCVVDGSGKTALMVKGSAQDVTFQRNRIFQAQNAVVFQKPAPKTYLQMKLQSNTFFDVKGSAFFVEAPWPAKNADGIDNQVAITQNLFVKCAAIMSAPDGKLPPNLAVKGNGRSKDSHEGNAPIGAPEADVILTSSDPNSDQFLRYSRDSKAATVPGGPAGVPPQ